MVRYVDAIVISTYGENKTEEYIKNKTNKRNWDIDDLSQYLEDTLKAQNNNLIRQSGLNVRLNKITKPQHSEAKSKTISSFGQTTKTFTVSVLGETTQTKSETTSSKVDTKNKSNISKFNISKFENATYLGEFKKNKAHGYGIFIFLDGSVYDGKVSKNRIHGNGRYIDAQGKVYEGKFRYGSFKTKIDKKTRDVIKLKPKTGIEIGAEIKGTGAASTKWFAAEKNSSGVYEMTAKGKSEMAMAISAGEGDSGSSSSSSGC